MARGNHTNEQMGVNEEATRWQSTCAHRHASGPSLCSALTVSDPVLDEEGKAEVFASSLYQHGSTMRTCESSSHPAARAALTAVLQAFVRPPGLHCGNNSRFVETN